MILRELVRAFIERYPRTSGVIAGLILMAIGIGFVHYGVTEARSYAPFWEGDRVTGTVVEKGDFEILAKWYDLDGNRYDGAIDVTSDERGDLKAGAPVALTLGVDDPSIAISTDRISDNPPTSIFGFASFPQTFVGFAIILFGIGMIVYHRP